MKDVSTVSRSKLLSNVAYEIRGALTQKSEEMEEAGHHIVKLHIGNLAPFGFNVPQVLQEELISGMQEMSGYTASQGLKEARVVVCEYMTNHQHVHGVTPDDVYMGNGASELILMALQGLLNAGDEVLLPLPTFPLWSAAVHLYGGCGVWYRCDETANWSPDVEHMAACITPRTRAIVLVNPNNPTGAVYTREVLLSIVELARRHRLVVMADEIYNQVLYDGSRHVCAASLADDVLFLTFSGLSKNFRACGYRAGWMVVSGARQRAQDYISGLRMLATLRLCANVFGQRAVIAVLRISRSFSESFQQELQQQHQRLIQQRDLSYQLLVAIPGLCCMKPSGAFYLFPRVDLAQFDFDEDKMFAEQLLCEKKILVTCGSGFGMPVTGTTCYFRITFLPYVSILKQCITGLSTFFQQHTKK